MGFTLHRTQSEKNGCLNPEKTGCFFNTIYTATYYIQPTTKQLLLKKTSINPNIKAKEAILWDSLFENFIVNSTMPEYKSFHPKTRKEWRKWLEKNHVSSRGVWMIYFKKESQKPKVKYSEAVEEALCFGWIDSLPGKLDEERAMLKFTPRKPKSAWSKLNKTRVEKLIDEGLMTVAGLAKIEQAKKDGSWNILTSSDNHIDGNSIPADLLKAFGKNEKALQNFKTFPPGYRKQFLFWIESAKRPETKLARIKQTVLMSAANKKPGIKGFVL